VRAHFHGGAHRSLPSAARAIKASFRLLEIAGRRPHGILLTLDGV